jgi:cysteine desulfurase
MSHPRLYADHNATTPLRAEARDALIGALDRLGNPSSIHAEGRAARALVEQARERLAGALQARPQDIVFTSGATEAAQLALDAAASEASDGVFLSPLEHDAVWAYARRLFPHAETIPVRPDGRADLAWLRDRLADGVGRPLVILQAANNETGVVQDVTGAARLLLEAGRGRLLCDAVQALGRIDLSGVIGVADWTILSSHKIGGPMGAGALVMSCAAPAPNSRPGGGQERGRRAGTENAPALAGFAAAAERAIAERETFVALTAAERDAFEAAVRARFAELVVFGSASQRLANTSCVALPDWRGETQVMALDLAGVAVSAGAACSSGKAARSRALTAMLAQSGDGALADCAIRASFGWATQAGDGARVADAYCAAAARARSRMPA